MNLTFDSTRRLFEDGDFLQLIVQSGRDTEARELLEPRVRVIVANALALAGLSEEAYELGKFDCSPANPARIRAQAEWTCGLSRWRQADIGAAISHARTAVRLARESKDPQAIAWAHLHLFRFLIERGPVHAIATALADARQFVSRSGSPQATAYLHNCVAVLEGQTGRFDEATRHLDIAEALLRVEPNAWLTGSLHTHRGSIACATCDFTAGEIEFKAAKQAAKRSGLHHATAADTCLGYVQLLAGEFDKAQHTLGDVLLDPSAAVVMKLAAADSLARVHLALGHVRECNEALEFVDRQVQQHPEIASVFHVRWAAVTRGRLAFKQGLIEDARKWAEKGTERAELLGDIPLATAANLLLAQISSACGHGAASAQHLLKASNLGATEIRDLQALYYFTASLTLEDDNSLSGHLRARSGRLWSNQNVVSLALEVDRRIAASQETQRSRPLNAESIHCIANSIASFFDLAHKPDLLAEEMLRVIDALGCSPGVRAIETREATTPPQSSTKTIALPLGTYRKRTHTLVCDVPDSPAKAILMADVLRLGRASVALERARQEERNRAALWPAPPIEEQAGALFLAEEMKTLLATARRIAPTTVPVLITGETGTGKEVLARTIHAYSSRAAATFLPFNCSSVPKDMLDSQLFGHRKGSFTGALENFPGVIRAARGGTLFLDEIGETTLDVQPKLLRFLDTSEVHPIGEAQPVKTDVRVIAATNADLDTLVADGRFREDLFYRLNIVRLHMPPLRERRVEIPTLAHHYLQKHAQEYHKGHLRLAEETMEYLVLYRWPGNVRQLANEMRRLAALAEADAVLMPEHLSPDIAASRKTVPASERTLEPTEIVVRIDQPLPAAVQHVERAMIQHAIRLTGGRMEETAALLGVSRKGLYLKRVRYGLEPPESAGAADADVAMS